MYALTEERPIGLHRLFEPRRPSQTEAEEAVRTLIRWAGDDPEREGLLETPARVLRAYNEWFAGYADDPAEHLARTFAEVAGYDEPVLLREIPFRSCCEHHMAPITGVAHVSYLPAGRVVGISKLARVVDCVAKRLQILARDWLRQAPMLRAAILRLDRAAVDVDFGDLKLGAGLARALDERQGQGAGRRHGRQYQQTGTAYVCYRFAHDKPRCGEMAPVLAPDPACAGTAAADAPPPRRVAAWKNFSAKRQGVGNELKTTG